MNTDPKDIVCEGITKVNETILLSDISPRAPKRRNKLRRTKTFSLSTIEESTVIKSHKTWSGKSKKK